MTENVVALKRSEPVDYSVEWYGTQRMLAQLSPEERVAAFSIGCTEVEMRTLARIAAKFVGPSILTAIAAGLEERK